MTVLQHASLSECVYVYVCVYLHSWILHRSTHVNGGLHWFFLQESEEQPRVTPTVLSTNTPSLGWVSKGMERPFSLKSRMQPGTDTEKWWVLSSSGFGRSLLKLNIQTITTLSFSIDFKTMPQNTYTHPVVARKSVRVVIIWTDREADLPIKPD